MKFEIDKQTLNDLSIEESHDGNNSVFNIFNKVHTFGGRIKLKSILSNPLIDIDIIQKRQALIKYIETVESAVFFNKNDADFIEFYLNQNSIKIASSKLRAIENAVMSTLFHSNEYYIISKGLKNILESLKYFYDFVLKLDPNKCPEILLNYRSTILDIFEQKGFISILQVKSIEKLTAIEIGYFDNLFRNSAKKELRILLDIMYDFDCYLAVAKVSKELGYTYPEINNGIKKQVHIKGLYHPFINNPISNNIDFDSSKNVIFLTGANMAGKSTFLKSIGIAIYLTHVGFPVPAQSMQTSLFNGLITTINLFDNIQQGYSHFYSEVMRVKEVAEKINTINNVFVIFDELFRGTNVKDAYDGSLAIINAFSKVDDNLFVVSTHIAEVAEELKSNQNVYFIFFGTEIKNGIPYYSYKLSDGVSHERLGMIIIQREKILEIIEKRNSSIN